jgi:hypothetical protein
MDRFDAHVGAIDTALEQTPESLKPAGVDYAIYVLNGMIHNAMLNPSSQLYEFRSSAYTAEPAEPALTCLRQLWPVSCGSQVIIAQDRARSSAGRAGSEIIEVCLAGHARQEPHTRGGRRYRANAT